MQRVARILSKKEKSEGDLEQVIAGLFLVLHIAWVYV